MPDIAYVNGAYIPIAEARVSILDRGFLFADGVYEVAAVIDGRLIDNEAHLSRLARSLRELRIENSPSMTHIAEVEAELVARNGLSEGLVYLQITRGAASDRDFGFPQDTAPTLVAFTQRKNIIASIAADTGVNVITVPDLRWARRDIKSVALLAQVLAKQAALEAGCQEAWMVDRDSFVTEGSSSTAFILTKTDVLVTRANSAEILPGCTRKVVQTLAAREGLMVEERSFSVDEAYDAKEAFLTSASNLILPVISIDGRAIGSGKPGEKSGLLRTLYIEWATNAAQSS
ncbi:D-amino-acid transaminase [Methylocystis sp. B8]|uniref:D-amino-acid transaminase n=1 Tax=Methylocystis sp. B8 TaxID=544938 RepID=UPI0010FF1592|nr:D-amino-acid transaminase [Methylocystis sp. B8]TLG79172.1 D-amino-acid transaminase [Methylocystis sp. B8]